MSIAKSMLSGLKYHYIRYTGYNFKEVKEFCAAHNKTLTSVDKNGTLAVDSLYVKIGYYILVPLGETPISTPVSLLIYDSNKFLDVYQIIHDPYPLPRPQKENRVMNILSYIDNDLWNEIETNEHKIKQLKEEAKQLEKVNNRLRNIATAAGVLRPATALGEQKDE